MMTEPSCTSVRGSHTVLVVDECRELRVIIRAFLEFHGYRVLDASGSGEALIICQRYTEPIHLLLTDMEMPGLEGWQLAELIRRLSPDIKVLYMSAETRDRLIQTRAAWSGTPFLEKPFSRTELIQAVRNALEEPLDSSLAGALVNSNFT